MDGRGRTTQEAKVDESMDGRGSTTQEAKVEEPLSALHAKCGLSDQAAGFAGQGPSQASLSASFDARRSASL